jgi:hypothetical protein
MKEQTATQKGLTREDLEILGYQTTSEQNFDSFDVFTAFAPAGLDRVEAGFVYLKSNYRNVDAEAAKGKLPKSGKGYVVIPKHLSGDRMGGLNAIFGPAVKVLIYEDLIWGKVTQVFEEYLANLQQNIPQERYYVAPRKEHSDPRARLDDEIIGILTDLKPIGDGIVTVVRAPAGIGKTTLARQLAKALADRVRSAETIAKSRVIPVFVESSHWGKLQLGSVEELWEMIDNSLRVFSPNLRISKALFEHLLRRGYLAFIFDGFDELCSHRQSAFTPRSVLDELCVLASASSAKIMVTTRTMFWEGAVGASYQGARILDLAPFNKQQAYGYFDNVFKNDPKKRDQARGLYSELIKSNRPPTPGGARVQFFNQPICVQMIGRCVEKDIGDTFEFEEGKSLVYQFLRQICERERRRQGLMTAPDIQLAALEQVASAELSTAGAVFDLRWCEAAGFDSRDIPRLVDHPLLSTSDAGDGQHRFCFRYDFLPEFFRARYLVSCMRNLSVTLVNRDARAWDLMASEANGKGNILEHMLPLMETKDLSLVAGCYAAASSLLGKGPRAKSFLFHLIRLLTDSVEQSLSKDERAERVFSLVGGKGFDSKKEVTGLYVEGQIDKLDLRGIHFVECAFVDASFVDCVADLRTKFEKCSFAGTFEVTGTEQKSWGDVVIDEECTLEFPSNLAWEAISKHGAGSKEENVRDAMKLGLAKFWRNGQPHLSIAGLYWSKGALGYSVHCKPLLDALLRGGVLQKIKIAGVQEGGYAFSREALPDLQRFIDNGQLTGKLREAYRMLLG